MKVKTAYKLGVCAYCPSDLVLHTFPVLYTRGRRGKTIYKSYACHDHVEKMLAICGSQGRAIPVVTVKAVDIGLDRR